MNTNILTALAIGLIGAWASAPLHAQEGSGLAIETVEIDIADLDVAQSGDMELANERVAKAVRRLCPARIEGPVKMYPDHRKCRREALSSARQQLVTIAARGGKRTES